MKVLAVARLYLCIVCVLLFGCNDTDTGTTTNTENSSGISVVFIPKVTGNAFFESANVGVQEYSAKHGFSVAYAGSAQADVSRQIAIVKDAIAKKPGAICISALDSTALDAVLQEARAAGIVVVTWDSDVSGNARSIMVSQGTPKQLGKMLVEMGAKSLASRGINPGRDVVRYVWHYSHSSVADQNSWNAAGEEYIRSFYPKWQNLAPQNYYSGQDPEKALAVGKQILTKHPEIDLIICNDSTSLPAQAQAAQDAGRKAIDLTITGFSSPNPMRAFCENGVIERWGLWDCKLQGALGCYIAWYLASGNRLEVGQRVDVPDIGRVEVMPNTVLDPAAYTAKDSGVILLPKRLEFTGENVGQYDF